MYDLVIMHILICNHIWAHTYMQSYMAIYSVYIDPYTLNVKIILTIITCLYVHGYICQV